MWHRYSTDDTVALDGLMSGYATYVSKGLHPLGVDFDASPDDALCDPGERPMSAYGLHDDTLFNNGEPSTNGADKGMVSRGAVKDSGHSTADITVTGDSDNDVVTSKVVGMLAVTGNVIYGTERPRDTIIIDTYDDGTVNVPAISGSTRPSVLWGDRRSVLFCRWVELPSK